MTRKQQRFRALRRKVEREYKKFMQIVPPTRAEIESLERFSTVTTKISY